MTTGGTKLVQTAQLKQRVATFVFAKVRRAGPRALIAVLEIFPNIC